MTEFTRRHVTRPGTEADNLTVDGAGRARRLTAVHGTAIKPGSAAVLVFHGSNQDGATFRRFAGHTFDALTARGAVVTYLDGHQKNWNDARIASDFPARRDGIDDVAFTRAAIDELVRRYGIDPHRVYAVGYSAGGAMVIRLLHEIPEQLAGAALISATVPAPENFMNFDRPAVPVPVVLFHGTNDRLVPYLGGMVSLWGFRPRGLGLSSAETASYFAQRNGIISAPVTRTLPVEGVQTMTIERTDYPAPGRSPVVRYAVHGGGHTVPGPKKAPFILGRTATNMVAAEEIADFFGLASAPSDDHSPTGSK